jgi:hypothetical protein
MARHLRVGAVERSLAVSREDKRPLKVASLYLLEDFKDVEPEEL